MIDDDDDEYPDDADLVADDNDDDEAETDVLDPCPHCRRLMYGDAEQCPHCGHYVSSETDHRPAAVWVIVTAVLLLVVVLWRWVA